NAPHTLARSERSLRKAALPGKSQRLDGRASRPGGIAIRHHIDWNSSLLLALGRHGGTDLFYKPELKLLAGLQSAPSDNERIGVERVHHFIEEQAQGMGLYTENLHTQQIALVRQTAHEFGCLVQIQFGQLVTRVTRQKVWQDILFDGGKRTKRLEIADTSAIAFRFDSAGSGAALVGHQNVSQFFAESVLTLQYIAIDDDTPALARSDKN